MEIKPITGILKGVSEISQTDKVRGKQFENVLTEFVGEVNTSQQDSNKITKDFVNGEDVELHEVMIAGEKAKTSFQLLMEIRNKTVDMYKELTRMPI